MKSIEGLHFANRFTLLAVWMHFSSLSYQRLPTVLLSDTANVETASEDNLTAVTGSTLTQTGSMSHRQSNSVVILQPNEVDRMIDHRNTI